MLTITYDPDFKGCVPDGRVEEVVDNIIAYKDQRSEVIVSNQTVIEELRLRICKDEISHEDIVFMFDDEEIHVNEYGAGLSGYPKGFLSAHLNRVTEILRCASDKRKINKPA